MNELMTDNAYEWSTAITNILWALVALASILYINKYTKEANTKVALWKAIFTMLFISNILAFSVHGMNFDISINNLIWIPINFLLGLMIALLMSATVHDYFGKKTMFKYLPYLILLALVFFTITQFNRDTFLIFIAYQTIFMLLTLAMYLHLAFNKYPGASTISFGIFLFIMAAAAQAIGRYELDLFIPLNQDGLYHIIGIPSTILLTIGMAKSLRESNTSL